MAPEILTDAATGPRLEQAPDGGHPAPSPAPSPPATPWEVQAQQDAAAAIALERGWTPEEACAFVAMVHNVTGMLPFTFGRSRAANAAWMVKASEYAAAGQTFAMLLDQTPFRPGAAGVAGALPAIGIGGQAVIEVEWRHWEAARAVLNAERAAQERAVGQLGSEAAAVAAPRPAAAPAPAPARRAAPTPAAPAPEGDGATFRFNDATRALIDSLPDATHTE